MKTETRSAQLVVRVTTKEAKEARRMARASRMKLGEYVRSLLAKAPALFVLVCVGCSVQAQQPNRSASQRVQVVFDGDSISAGGSTATGPTVTTSADCYPAQARELLSAELQPLEAFAWTNNGVGGETTPGMSSRAISATDPLYSATNFDANVVIGLEISNDIVTAKADASTAYADVVAYCRARRAVGWTVGIGTSISRNNAGFEPVRDAVNASIRSNLTTDCPGAFVVDYAADPQIGADGASANLTYFTDGVHPTIEGAGILARIASTAIEDHLRN